MNILSEALNGGCLSKVTKARVISHLQQAWEIPEATAKRWVYGKVPLKSQNAVIARQVIAKFR